MQLRKRNSSAREVTKKLNKMDIDEDYIDLDEESDKITKQKILTKDLNKKPRGRGRPLKKKSQDSDEAIDSSQSPSEKQDDESDGASDEISMFLQPKIETILSKYLKSDVNTLDVDEQTNNHNQKYLVKYKFKSYHHCKWLTPEECEACGYILDKVKLRSVNIKIARLRKQKISQKFHFNPNYLIPDRIIGSTDLFSVIHHKKANQIKGTWHQSLQIVCLKILNFEKNNYPFGTLLIEEIQPCDKQQKIQLNENNEHVFSMQVILNRLYFCFYKNYQQIWKDIGRSINKYLKDNSQNKESDYYKAGEVLRECAIFLYIQWYILSKERFKKAKEEFTKKIVQITEVDDEIRQFKSNFADAFKYCERNVFLNEKAAQKPHDNISLDHLNPDAMSLNWLTSEVNLSKPFQFKFLYQKQMAALDLNVEVDRFYLVKWKELSYSESTWEKQSIINNPEKIQEFKNVNKMPNKQSREGLEAQLKHHQALVKCYRENPEFKLARLKFKKPSQIIEADNALNILGRKLDRPKEYKGKDILVFKNYKLLKEFQNQSLNWFIKSWHQNRNTILADEMGLGKTIQVLAFLYHLFTYQKVLGPFLILAPLTTLQQWRREIESWTNFNCLLYYDEGKAKGKDIIELFEMNYLHTRKNGEIVESKIPKFQIFLTNYESFLREFQMINKIAFQHIVVDEAHKLKNTRANLAKKLSTMACKRKTLMTGTPVQNNTKELWSLLNVIEPDIFSKQEDFVASYGNLQSKESVAALKKAIKPYLLRRVKEDVEKVIPKLSEIIIDVEMTKIQKTVYKGLLQKNKGELVKGLSSTNFNNLAMQLRKCCNHPFLLSQDLEDQISKDCKNYKEKNEKFMNSSGKAILLMKLLEKFKEEKKKTLLFSQFVTVLQFLQPFLELKNFKCEILHGGISASDRHRAISRFTQQNNDSDIFLISTKAGGVGINLTAATEIVIFDSDWNPQNDIQATARAHRIGQRNQVTVYRLIIANSYEAEMFRSSSKKLGIDKAIFNGEYFKSSNNKESEFEQAMSREEIQMLLRKGVLGFLENNQKDEEFFNQGIEEILQKNSRRVQYAITGESCTFSKTKFNADISGENLDINAANFWEVALKDVESPIQKLVSKLNTFENYSNVEQQQQLMLEALNIVTQFVRARVSGTASNAEDERILYNFLQKIGGQRKFEKQYRKIADKLVEEMEKPSRRFRVTANEIRAVRAKTGIVEVEEEYNVSKKEERYSNDFEEDGDENIEYAEQIMDVINNIEGADQKPKEVKKYTKRLKNEQNSDQNELNSTQSLGKEYEKICVVCLKPKCTIFCNGICGRSFHEQCWQKHLLGDHTITPAIELQEMGMSFNDWTQKVVRSYHCLSCSTSSKPLNCWICGQHGFYSNSLKNQETLYRCKQKKCWKFYHLHCLNQSDFTEIINEANKKASDIESLIDRLCCPVHYCFKCRSRIKTSQIASSCVKCAKTYHIKCLDYQSFAELNQKSNICIDHMSAAEVNTLVEDYQLIDQDKKDLKELKIRQKKQKIKMRMQQKLAQAKDQIEYKQQDQEIKISALKENSQVEINEPVNKLNYFDFKLTPLLKVDFRTYKGLWCRYCGTRYSDAFHDSPWGSFRLCLHHNKLWRKNKLDLTPFTEEPKEPILRKETELNYLNKMAKDNKNVDLPKLILILEDLNIKHLEL